MISVETLKQQCEGRWFGILSNLGINVRTDGRHEPCPICQGGIDRFRMERDGSGYYCNQCQKHAGDTISLIQRCLNIDFHEAMGKIQGVVGGCGMEKIESEKTYDVKKMLNKVWTESMPLTGDDPVIKYLKSRSIKLVPDNVKFHKSCYEPDTQKSYPAMIARVQNHEGKPVSLHRLYLGETGKADIEKPKKLMPGTEVLRGCAVRLFSPEDPRFEDGVLGIAEGIETAMSAAQGQGIATWAAISSTIMESFEPPESIKEVIIFGDNDANFTGEKAAYTLANKLYLKDLIVDVMIPNQVGDFNDVLKFSGAK